MQAQRTVLPGVATSPVLIGMVHLRALPGSPTFDGDLARIGEAALQDAHALGDGGADAILVENYFDTPFYPHRVPPETIANMSTIVAAIAGGVELPVGVNVLRNDACAAMAIAHATGARFIRVNILTGARLTDQGVVQGSAYELLRLRARLGGEGIRILADVNVKHSAPLAPYDAVQEVEDCVDRGGADALIVSGEGTGKGIDAGELRRVRDAAGETPVLVGSGANAATIGELATLTDGFIVGTGVKVDGDIAAPVDPDRVRQLVTVLDRVSGRPGPRDSSA